ncbi:hypothetical protein C823_007931 [Eubacterium plexicaudatum ASF492]|nr:hypothetical protein C823_007931 [Eubacterium plexicaudatum ASF492]
MMVMWCSPPGNEDYKGRSDTGIVTRHLSFLALCFYKALHPVTVFLVISFQAVMDISSYMAVILIGKPGKNCLICGTGLSEERIITSEKSLALAVGIGTVVVLFPVFGCALLMYVH